MGLLAVLQDDGIFILGLSLLDIGFPTHRCLFRALTFSILSLALLRGITRLCQFASRQQAKYFVRREQEDLLKRWDLERQLQGERERVARLTETAKQAEGNVTRLRQELDTLHKASTAATLIKILGGKRAVAARTRDGLCLAMVVGGVNIPLLDRNLGVFSNGLREKTSITGKRLMDILDPILRTFKFCSFSCKEVIKAGSVGQGVATQVSDLDVVLVVQKRNKIDPSEFDCERWLSVVKAVATHCTKDGSVQGDACKDEFRVALKVEGSSVDVLVMPDIDEYAVTSSARFKPLHPLLAKKRRDFATVHHREAQMCDVIRIMKAWRDEMPFECHSWMIELVCIRAMKGTAPGLPERVRACLVELRNTAEGRPAELRDPVQPCIDLLSDWREADRLKCAACCRMELES